MQLSLTDRDEQQEPSLINISHLLTNELKASEVNQAGSGMWEYDDLSEFTTYLAVRVYKVFPCCRDEGQVFI